MGEVILSIVPIILGEEISLFGNMGTELDFAFINAESYKSGIVQVRYTALSEVLPIDNFGG